jgi:hypothetical protein
MSLNLDARQRAMLQEMGVTVWTRAETAAPQAPAAMHRYGGRARHRAPASRTGHGPATGNACGPAPAPAARRTPRPHLRRQPLLQGWAHQAQPLRCACTHRSCCTTADPAQTPPGLGAGWLIVTEGIAAADPWGDAGKLLDNMLRAMQLHRHPACSWQRWNARTRRPHGRRGCGASRRGRSAGRGGDHRSPLWCWCWGMWPPAPPCRPHRAPGQAARSAAHRGRAPGRGHHDPAFLLRPKTPKPPPGPTCAVHWRWCARPKAAHPTRAEPPGLQRRATSPCNGSLIPADDAAVCASDHRTIAGRDAPPWPPQRSLRC